MKFKTQVFILSLWFTCSFTLRSTNLTTICVVVKNVIWWSNFSTWWFGESRFPNNKLWTKSKQFWELSWFKKHDVIWWCFFVFLIDLGIERLEFFQIKVSWFDHINHLSKSAPTWHWFVDWIITHNVWIAWKSFGYLFLKSNIFVLESIVIMVKSSK